jgi:hypothetical protein
MIRDAELFCELQPNQPWFPVAMACSTRGLSGSPKVTSHRESIGAVHGAIIRLSWAPRIAHARMPGGEMKRPDFGLRGFSDAVNSIWRSRRNQWGRG